MDLLSPEQKILHFRILQKLGTGGMGDVYVAEDQKLGRRVAIKVLQSEIRKEENAKRRFLQEARSASLLNHPNIVTIYSIESMEDLDFIVMEYVEGVTLSAYIAEKKILDLATISNFGLQIANALSAAHSAGIIHRDIKSANILITKQGTVKVLDFGLAKLAQESPDAPSLTKEGSIVGTASFLSPEQVRGEKLDARSDLFSFGSVLYQMATGHLPFTGPDLPSIIFKIATADPAVPSSVRTDLPLELDRVVMKALAKNKEQRFQTAQEIAGDLQNLITNRPSSPTLSQISAVRISAEQPTAESTALLPTVAVLYFENLSKEKEDEYFRDGMTEDIIAELWKIKDLKVFPRSAVLGYREKPVPAVQIGMALQASYVLEGSVRRSGNRLRISPELVDTRTGHAVWAARLDREWKDILDVQDEIARSIAEALRVTLSPQEEKAIAKKPTENVLAYDHYLRGRSYSKRRVKSSLELALELYDKAISLDPQFALAYAGVGIVRGFLYYWHGNDPTQAERGLKACDKALELEPDLPDALAARSVIFTGIKRYDEAIRDARKAVAAKPDCHGGYWALGCALFASGRYEEAVEIAERAVETSGDDDHVYIPYTLALDLSGRSKEALDLKRRHTRALEQTLELVPEDARARVLLATHYAGYGRVDESLHQLDLAIASHPDDPIILYNAACAHALLGRKQDALKLLKNILKTGFRANLDWVRRDPDLEVLHGDPDFEALMKE